MEQKKVIRIKRKSNIPPLYAIIIKKQKSGDEDIVFKLHSSAQAGLNARNSSSKYKNFFSIKNNEKINISSQKLTSSNTKLVKLTGLKRKFDFEIQELPFNENNAYHKKQLKGDYKDLGFFDSEDTCNNWCDLYVVENKSELTKKMAELTKIQNEIDLDSIANININLEKTGDIAILQDLEVQELGWFTEDLINEYSDSFSDNTSDSNAADRPNYEYPDSSNFDSSQTYDIDDYSERSEEFD